MSDDLKPTKTEQAILDGILRNMRAGKVLQERRAARYAYLRAHEAERQRDIKMAVREFKETGNKGELQAVLNRWSLDISTFAEVSHGKTKT